ncbi:MAG: TadE/TadG family type IV pilus assembly protein [Paracoccaceae bacterium]
MKFLKPSRLLARFRRDDEASISIEFVLTLPLLMLWFVGSFVFFDAFKTYSQSAKATYTIGDIMSRQITVDNAFIDNLYVLMDRMTPRSSSGKWMRISLIQFQNNGYSVVWSRAQGGGTALSDGTIPLSIMPEMADGDTVVLSETYVPFSPMVGWVGITAHTFITRLTNLPRFVGSIAKLD